MKTADVTELTTLYRYQRSKYGAALRAVVLAVGTWIPVYAGGKSFRTFGEAPIGYRVAMDADLQFRGLRGADHGWLCLVESDTADGTQIPDSAMLGQAEPALRSVLAQGTPVLPRGLHLALVPAREIVQTWESWVADEARRRDVRLSREEREAEATTADAAALERITDAIGDDALRPFRHKMSGQWVAMEAAMNAFAGKRIKDIAAACLDELAALDS